MVKLEDEAGKEEGREEGVVGHLQEKSRSPANFEGNFKNYEN